VRQCVIYHITVLLKLYVDYIERVIGMTTDKLVAVSQDRDSSDGTAAKQFFNYLNIILSSNNCCLKEY